MQDISEYVSSEIIDLISLCSLSTEELELLKELDLSKELGQNAYEISIINSEENLKVITQPISNPFRWGQEQLPWSTEGNIKYYNGTTPSINNPSIIPSLNVSSSEQMIVWCLRTEDAIIFGLGTLKNGET
jgi:hypothetical protein